MLVNVKKAAKIESSEEEKINRVVRSNDEENSGLKIFRATPKWHFSNA